MKKKGLITGSYLNKKESKFISTVAEAKRLFDKVEEEIKELKNTISIARERGENTSDLEQNLVNLENDKGKHEAILDYFINMLKNDEMKCSAFLQEAIGNDDLETVKMLEENKLINLNETSAYIGNEDLLTYAIKVCEPENLRVVNYLLENIEESIIKDKKYIHNIPLHEAVNKKISINNDEESIEKLNKVIEKLIEKGADVNKRDLQGRTPIFYAVQNNNEEMVKLLIEKGAKVDIIDKNGYNLLHFTRNSNIAKMLLDNVEDKKEMLTQEDFLFGGTPLYLIANQIALTEVEHFNGVNVFNKNEYEFLEENRLETIEYVIQIAEELGIKNEVINAKTKNGSTPLDVAVLYKQNPLFSKEKITYEGKSKEVFDFLIENGAKCNNNTLEDEEESKKSDDYSEKSSEEEDDKIAGIDLNINLDVDIDIDDLLTTQTSLFEEEYDDLLKTRRRIKPVSQSLSGTNDGSNGLYATYNPTAPKILPTCKNPRTKYKPKTTQTDEENDTTSWRWRKSSGDEPAIPKNPNGDSKSAVSHLNVIPPLVPENSEKSIISRPATPKNPNSYSKSAVQHLDVIPPLVPENEEQQLIELVESWYKVSIKKGKLSEQELEEKKLKLKKELFL